MLDRIKLPTITEICGLNDGAEWHYGRALARAWAGKVSEATAYFDAATSQARSQGHRELHDRLALHRLILKCRCEMHPLRRSQLAQALIARLRTVEAIEDYRPPFHVVAGKWLAESLGNDIDDPEFVLQTLEAVDPEEHAGLSLGDLLLARLGP